MWTICVITFPPAEPKQLTPKNKKGKVYFSSQFVKISGHSQLAQRQDDMEDEYHRGATVHGMAGQAEGSRQ